MGSRDEWEEAPNLGHLDFRLWVFEPLHDFVAETNNYSNCPLFPEGPTPSALTFFFYKYHHSIFLFPSIVNRSSSPPSNPWDTMTPGPKFLIRSALAKPGSTRP